MTWNRREERLAGELLARLEGCPSAGDLQDFASSVLSDEARSTIEQHLRDCPECREALAVAGVAPGPGAEALPAEVETRSDALIDASLRADASAGDSRSRVLIRRPWALGLAAAAAVVAFFVLVPLREPVVDPAPVFREADGSELRSLIDPERPLPRDDCRLRWSDGPAGSHHELVVLSEDMKLLARRSGLTESEFLVPTTAVASLPPGGRLFWRVETTLPDGRRVESETFAARVE